MTTYYTPGDRIGLGDLIATYIQLHATPHDQRDPHWHREEHLMRATLNQTTHKVEHLPGTITVIPLRPPIRPTGTSCQTPTPGPSEQSHGPNTKPPT